MAKIVLWLEFDKEKGILIREEFTCLIFLDLSQQVGDATLIDGVSSGVCLRFGH